MTKYASLDEIKTRSSFLPHNFSEYNEEEEFDELLTMLEEETRDYINSFFGVETLHKTTNITKVMDAPNERRVRLRFPIDNVSNVEIRSSSSSSWTTFDSGSYRYTDRELVLDKSQRSRRHRSGVRSIGKSINRDFQNLNTWLDVCNQIRITYTAGYDTIPSEIKNIQIEMINRLLRKQKISQTVSALSPTDGDNENPDILSKVANEDIKERLNNIRGHANQVRII